jgi:hypothetical protein
MKLFSFPPLPTASQGGDSSQRLEWAYLNVPLVNNQSQIDY